MRTAGRGEIPAHFLLQKFFWTLVSKTQGRDPVINRRAARTAGKDGTNMKYNRGKLQGILDWMQGMDRNGTWSTALDEIDSGDLFFLTYGDIADMVKETIWEWVENGLNDDAARTILSRLDDAKEG